MPKLSHAIPKRRHHRASGQAVVVIAGQTHYLGPWRSNASKFEYDRLIGEWLAAGRPQQLAPETDTTVVELANHYWQFAKGYYVKDGRPTGIAGVKVALHWLNKYYGHTPAAKFGPLALKALQMRMVEATLPHLQPIVADMVRLQRLTGARPAEICILRPCDIDRTADVWAYRPARHKTEHHGQERVVFIGPRAQAILMPYLLRAGDAYCFSPKESEAKHNAQRREERASPMTPSHAKRKRLRRPARTAGEHYTVESYRRAIHRAADKADAKPHEANADLSAEQRIIPRWSPNRLRHSAATEIRARYGLEAAATVLGHAKADVTQIYAERDLAKAAAIMRDVG